MKEQPIDDVQDQDNREQDTLTGIGLLAVRLLNPPQRDGIARWPMARLIAGQLPPGLPSELPLPTGTRLFGSYEQARKGRATIVLDVDETPDWIRTFYRHHLIAAGWQFESAAEDWGDQMRNVIHQDDLYLWNERGPRLRINVRPQGQGGSASDVRIDILSDLEDMPWGRQQQRRVIEEAELLFSTLLLPQDVRVQAEKYRRFDRSPWWTSITTLFEAEQNLADIHAHYSSRLEDTGWAHYRDGQEGALIWSTWDRSVETVEGKWSVFVSVVKLPWTKAQYRASVEMEWLDGNATPAWLLNPLPFLCNNTTASINVTSLSGSTDKAFSITLTRHLLSDMFGRGQRWQDVHLHPERVPNDLPIVFSSLPRSQILGSSEWISQGLVVIVATTDVSPDDILDVYRAHFHEHDWRDQGRSSVPAGFAATGIESAAFVLPYGAMRTVVEVNHGPEGTTDVRLIVHRHLEDLPRAADDTSLSTRRDSRGGALSFGVARLPEMAPSAGDSQVYVGGTIGEDITHELAELWSARPLLEIHAHYAQQLAYAGWVEGETGTDAALAWSTWTVPGEGKTDVQGRLLVLRSPFEAHRYLLEMQMLHAVRDSGERNSPPQWCAGVVGPALP